MPEKPRRREPRHCDGDPKDRALPQLNHSGDHQGAGPFQLSQTTPSPSRSSYHQYSRSIPRLYGP